MSRRLSLEQKRDDLIAKVNRLDAEERTQRATVSELYAKAHADAQEKLKTFNATYQKLMRSVDQQCFDAAIDPDSYMPVINHGKYREASSKVHQRLMYFLTLLEMSLRPSYVQFPRFLLIDTPENRGVDAPHLIAALAKVVEVLASSEEPAQVILTTGIGKVPAEAVSGSIGTLRDTDGQRLLREKKATTSERVSGHRSDSSR
jgi:hypothetical protein